MYRLAFDTTGAQCAILLQKDETVLGRYAQYMDFGQAEVLIPQLKKMLEASGLEFCNLDLLIVCTGPGSFTGVRSSIAAARAFGLAAPGLKVAGVSAFEAYALALEPEERAELNAVIIETKRDDFYLQLFNKKLERLSAPAAVTYEEALALLRHKKVSLVGDGVERFLCRPSGLSLHVIKMLEALPIETLAEAGLEAFNAKNLDFPKPLYLRAPDVSAPKTPR